MKKTVIVVVALAILAAGGAIVLHISDDLKMDNGRTCWEPQMRYWKPC